MEDLEDLHNQVQEHLYGRPMGPLSRAVINFIDKTYDILTSEDPKHFKTLISYLMTPSNEQQHLEAKSLFNVYKKRYSDQLVTRLTEQVESPGSKARAVSALLLRNLFNEAAFRNSLRAGTRLAVKGRLLNCVNNERDKSMIKILGDTLSGLAADDAWPELMNFMFDRVGSDDFWLQESALLVFSRLGGDILGPHITRLHDVFTSCLGNVGSADVRIAAVVAGLNCVQCLQRSSDWYRFQALLPIMMQCLEIKVLNDGGEVLNDGDEAQKVLNDGDEAQEVLSDGEVHEVLNDGEAQEVLNVGDEALSLLIELAKTEPRFLKGHLVVVVEGMLRIAEAESLQERTRLLAIEFVTTLVEAREPAPRMLRDLLQLVISRLSDYFMRRKLREFISRLFAILMRMLLADIEDDSEWNSSKNEDEDESSSYRVGKECLHRLATALGRKIAYKQLSRYLAKPDDKWQFHGRPDHKWHKHLAALIALAQIAKGRSKVMIPNLEQVVTEVLNSFQDPHPRVRWAAINAIGELCNHGGPSLLNQYLNRVLAALDLALDDVNPRVQAHAVSVVLNFSSQCRPHILATYLDGKLDKLILLPPTDPNIRVLTLANLLETSTNVKKRGRLAVHLGEMFEEPLGVLTLDLVRRKLLTCVGKEDDGSVIKGLCHTIVTFFNVLCIKTSWPELFSSVEWCGFG